MIPLTPAAFEEIFAEYRHDPVRLVVKVIGAQPDYWQGDALASLALDDVWNEAIMAYRGPGKTAVGAWATMWFLFTRWQSLVITTAPNYIKQVKNIQWREIHHWWNRALIKSPWLGELFKIYTTELKSLHYPGEWQAVGWACKEPGSIEGARAQHMMVYMDEAKEILPHTWNSVHGMRSGTTEFKWLAVSSPGGPTREHTKLWSQYAETWPNRIRLHPESLRDELRRPEAMGIDPASGNVVLGRYALRGARTYYSTRGPSAQMIVERRRDWGGRGNPWFDSQIVGDPPTLESNKLIRWDLVENAQYREECEALNCNCSREESDNIVIGIDVARTGNDRTVLIVMRGGKVIHAENVSIDVALTTVDIESLGGYAKRGRALAYRSGMATAALAIRLAKQYRAWGVAVDDATFGGVVAELVSAAGFYVVPILHNARPFGIPEKAEDRRALERRRDPLLLLKNFKAQLGMFLRTGFDQGHICLAELSEGAARDAILNPLLAQLGGVTLRIDEGGIAHVEDPRQAEAESAAFFDDPEEARRSPDHFHALTYAWWLSGGGHKKLKGWGGTARHQGRLGRPRGPGDVHGGGNVPAGTPRQPVSPIGVGGQGVHLGRFL